MRFQFLKVGDFFVSPGHIVSVQFKADGSAVVHTMSDNMTTADPGEVEDLGYFTGRLGVPQNWPNDPPPPAPPPPPPPVANQGNVAVVPDQPAPAAPAGDTEE